MLSSLTVVLPLVCLCNWNLPKSFPGGSDSKESPCSAGDLGSFSWMGRSPGEGKGYLLQYSGLENPHGQRSLVGYSSWVSPGRNTGVGSPSLLQGIFPTEGLHPGLLHCRQILYHLSRLIINYVCSDLQFCFPSRHLLCHMHVCVSVMSNSLRPHGLEPVKFLCPWAFSGKNPGVGAIS